MVHRILFVAVLILEMCCGAIEGYVSRIRRCVKVDLSVPSRGFGAMVATRISSG